MHDDPRNLELEAAIAADPDDRAALQVYADWLLERRDPRGELIALQCGGAAQAAIDELLERHGTYLLGPLARFRMHLTWGIGYIRSFDLAACGVWKSAVVPMLQHPSLRFATELKLAGPRGLDVLPPSLRALELRDVGGADLSVLAPIAERLTRLAVRGDWSPDGLAFPAVESAQFESFTGETGERLGRVSWPRLASLTLGRCYTPYAEALVAGMSGLRTIRVEQAMYLDAFCEFLSRSPLARQLTSLALWGDLTDRGASALLDERFTALAEVELTSTQVSADGIELLKVRGLRVESASWQPRGDRMIMDG